MSEDYLSKRIWTTNKSIKQVYNRENLAISVIRELVKDEILQPLKLREVTCARKIFENEKYEKLILQIKDKKDALLGRIKTVCRRPNIFKTLEELFKKYKKTNEEL